MANGPDRVDYRSNLNRPQFYPDRGFVTISGGIDKCQGPLTNRLPCRQQTTSGSTAPARPESPSSADNDWFLCIRLP